jgi:hypothetical protein
VQIYYGWVDPVEYDAMVGDGSTRRYTWPHDGAGDFILRRWLYLWTFVSCHRGILQLSPSGSQNPPDIQCIYPAGATILSVLGVADFFSAGFTQGVREPWFLKFGTDVRYTAWTAASDNQYIRRLKQYTKNCKEVQKEPGTGYLIFFPLIGTPWNSVVVVNLFRAFSGSPEVVLAGYPGACGTHI